MKIQLPPHPPTAIPSQSVDTKATAAKRSGHDEVNHAPAPKKGGLPTSTVQLPQPGAALSTQKLPASGMTASQRHVLREELGKLSCDKAKSILAHLDQHPDGANLKEPSVIVATTADHTTHRWTVGPTYRSGSFGKFRFAFDAQEKAHAVKQYRLEAKREKYVGKVKAASSSLVGAGYLSARDCAVWQRLAATANENAHRSLNDAVEQLRYRRKPPEALLKQISLRTQHVPLEDVEHEQAMYHRAGSAFAAQQTVRIGGDVYAFSKLMHGELFDLGNAEMSRTQRNALARFTCLQGALGLAQMHEAGLVHRDIKPDNLFIDAGGHIHVGDLGLAAQVDEAGTTLGKCGTPEYLAPEILSGKPYDRTVDTFSLGVTVATLAMADLPFEFQWDKASGNTKTIDAGIFEKLHAALPFDKQGKLKTADLEDLLDNMPVGIPYQYDQNYTQMLSFFIDFHIADAPLCELVLRRMLCPKAQDRASTAEIGEAMAFLMPQGSPEYQLAQRGIAEFSAKDAQWAAEYETVRAYARAFASSPDAVRN